MFFYACRWTIGECLNTMPDCTDQIQQEEWSAATSTELTLKRHAHITFQAEASGLQTDCSEEKSTNHSHHLFVSSLFNPIGWALRQQTTWQHRFSSSWSRPTGTKLRPTNVPLQWEMQTTINRKGNWSRNYQWVSTKLGIVSKDSFFSFIF